MGKRIDEMQRSSYSTLLGFAYDVFQSMTEDRKAVITRVQNLGDRLTLTTIAEDDVFVEENDGNLEFTLATRIITDDTNAVVLTAESSWKHKGEPGWDLDVAVLSANEVRVAVFRTVVGDGLNNGRMLSLAYSMFSTETSTFLLGLYKAISPGQGRKTGRTADYPDAKDNRNALLVLGIIFALYSIVFVVSPPTTEDVDGNCLCPSIAMMVVAAILPLVNPASVPKGLWQGMAMSMMCMAGISYFALMFTIAFLPMLFHLLLSAFMAYEILSYGNECKWDPGYVRYLAIGFIISAIVSGAGGAILTF